jgi:hypothetical protein
MSQSIAALITNQYIPFDDSIIQFIFGEVQILPLNIDHYDLEDFVNEAKKFNRFTDYLAYLNTHPIIPVPPDISEEDNEGYAMEIAPLLDLFNNYPLHSFIVEYYEEVGETPTRNYFMIVINGEIIHNTILSEDDKSDWSLMEESCKKIKYQPNWVALESYFRSYETAEAIYLSLKLK